MRQLLRAKANTPYALQYCNCTAYDLGSRLANLTVMAVPSATLRGNDPSSPAGQSIIRFRTSHQCGGHRTGLVCTRLIMPDEVFDIQEQGAGLGTCLK